MGLGQVYANALGKALAGKASVHHYASNLPVLWSDKEQGVFPIVIVWDQKLGETADDRLLEKHLTALDWALAWSLKQVRNGQTIPQIVIVDATAGAWKDTWAWSVRHQLLADMPWVTLAAPVVSKEDASFYEWALSTTAMDSNGIATDGVIRKGADGTWGLYPKPTLKSPVSATLEGLNKLWIASLRLSDENHDVNNIIGARLMLEIPGAARNISRRTDPMKALITRARWSGFDNYPKWEPWALPNTQYLYGQNISAILIDDKHESGWALFLQGALGDGVQLRALSSPDILIKFLEKQKDIFKRRDFIAGVSVRDCDEDKNTLGVRPEIIFLDLRLYRSEEVGRLKQDVEKLLAIASGWKGACPAWEGIKQEDLDEIRSWLGAGCSASSPSHLNSLLLLPRLLALALPLTPIILFSATGRADVQKILKPYRNIFTNFQKPNPLADPDSVPAAVSALHQALDWAAPMLRRRLQLAYVQQVYDELEAKRPTKRPPKHFEIYFDESGSGDELISTAVVGVFANKTAADEVQLKFIEEFAKTPTPGVSWARRKDIRHIPRLDKAEEFFKGNLANWQKRINCNGELLREKTIDAHFNIISARAKKKGIRSTGRKGALGKFVDHKRLDDAIRLKLEMSLLVLFSYANEVDSIGIFMQTKASLVSDSVESFETKSYFTKGMAFPLVRAWLQMWGEKKYQELSGLILSIRTQKLSSGYEDTYLSIDEFKDRRALHDIADWGAAFVGLGGEINSAKTNTIRTMFGDHVFNKLYYSDFNSSNCEILSDALRSLVSNAQPYIARAIGLLCSAPLVESVGRQALPKVWKSEPQEHYWLWAIFPYISKAIGADLVSGLDGEMARQAEGLSH